MFFKMAELLSNPTCCYSHFGMSLPQIVNFFIDIIMDTKGFSLEFDVSVCFYECFNVPIINVLMELLPVLN